MALIIDAISMNRITTCPHCSTSLRVSEQITDKALICPHCLADVDNPQPGFQIRAADINTDVKRDMRAGSIVLAVLIGLCVLGIVVVCTRAALRSTSPSIPNTPRPESLVFYFAALDVLVSIAIIRRLVLGISGVRAPSAGRALGIIFLSLGTIVAVTVFLFFTCLSLVH